MKTNSRLSLLLAAALLAACSSEENEPMVPDAPETPETPTEGYHFTFDGGVGTAAATRASWNDDDGTGNLKFQWDYTPEETVGDELVMAFVSDTLLASTAGNRYTYANINPHSEYASDAHWAAFKTVEKYKHDMSGGQYDGHKVVAVTPLCADNKSEVSSSADTFSATLPMPATFTQVADQEPEFLSNYMYMYATDTIANGSATLAFNHIPATFRFIVTNKRPEETNITSIQVSLADAQPVASQLATVNHEAKLTFSSDTYTKVTTLLDENGTLVEMGAEYTAYALALPLASDSAFYGKKIQFTIATDSRPEHEYLSFVLDGALIEGANRTLTDGGVYNWVGGKSYTIRMSLSDVLTFKSITVTDWTEASINAGEAEE